MMKPLFLLLFFSAALSAQTRYYVNPVAFGQNNGLTWYDAFTDLHSAMAAAEAGDEIWIAEGTYYPSSTGDRDAHFQPLSGVQVYGGFAGTEMDLSQRDWEAHPTVLDGDIGVAGDSTDNSYNLLLLANPDTNTIIDGLYFQRAVANKTNSFFDVPGISGAAIYMASNNYGVFTIIRNCIFYKNTSFRNGGAIYVDGGGGGSASAQFLNCKFLFNRALNGNGGGIAIQMGSQYEIKDNFSNCIFDSNIANYLGGAIFYSNIFTVDTLNINECTFKDNSIILQTGQGNNFHIRGTGFPIPTSVIFRKCTFKNTLKLSHGGNCTAGLNLSNENIYWEFDSITTNNINSLQGSECLNFGKMVCKNSQFKNSAISGGFIAEGYCKQNSEFSNLYFENSSFSYYSVRVDSVTLENIFFDNPDNIDFSVFSIEVDKNIEIKNSLINGGGIPNIWPLNKYLISAKNKISILNTAFLSTETNITNADSTIITNSILQFSNPQILNTNLHPGTSYALLANNLFTLPEPANLPGWTQQNNLWNTDPLFVQPDSGDFRLQACSPAINAGDNLYAASATDRAGQARIQFGTVDIGPYESGPIGFESSASVQPACPQAANGSAEVLGQDICLPATYTWSHDPLLQGPLAQSLAPGTYTVTVTDSRGRSGSAVLEIPLAQPPLLHLNTVPVLCGDTLGGSVVAEADGLPPFQYQWAGFPDTDSVLQGLPMGQYPLTVTDGRGCTAAALAQVDKTDGLDMGVQVTPVSCFGASDGGYLIVPLNGKAPFQWQWTNGPAAPAYSGLSAGPYSGSVTDALGCTLQWQFTLQQPDPISASASVTHASGPQNNDGAVSLDAVLGGTQPYTIQWSNGQSGPDLLGVAPGTYTVSITDERGCLYSAQYVVDFSIGTQEAAAQWQVQVFPNPAGEFLFFRTDAPGQVRVRLYDALGRAAVESVVFSGQTALSVAHLPAGAYVWVLEGAGVRVQGRCLAGRF